MKRCLRLYPAIMCYACTQLLRRGRGYIHKRTQIINRNQKLISDIVDVRVSFYLANLPARWCRCCLLECASWVCLLVVLFASLPFVFDCFSSCFLFRCNINSTKSVRRNSDLYLKRWTNVELNMIYVCDTWSSIQNILHKCLLYIYAYLQNAEGKKIIVNYIAKSQREAAEIVGKINYIRDRLKWILLFINLFIILIPT